jgi:hypothetical protein
LGRIGGGAEDLTAMGALDLDLDEHAGIKERLAREGKEAEAERMVPAGPPGGGVWDVPLWSSMRCYGV